MRSGASNQSAIFIKSFSIRLLRVTQFSFVTINDEKGWGLSAGDWQFSGKLWTSHSMKWWESTVLYISDDLYHKVWLEQMKVCMLQQEAGCQPAVTSPRTTSTTHTRQFSSIELKDSSDQPKLGTNSLSVTPAHLQDPSTSMSLPEVQNSLKCLLESVSMWWDSFVARTSVSSDISLDCFISQCFLASIQVTFSLEI